LAYQPGIPQEKAEPLHMPIPTALYCIINLSPSWEYYDRNLKHIPPTSLVDNFNFIIEDIFLEGRWVVAPYLDVIVGSRFWKFP
jgi:hypothetical protein